MNVLYLDCGMGAAGDMLTAALLSLFDEPAAITAELNALGVPGVRFVPEASEKCGISGIHMHVLVGETEEDEHLHDHHHHDHDHHHHSAMDELRHLISHLRISDTVRRDVLAVYELIAQAESQVHGEPMEHIHFHEVGTMDALADITAVCYLVHKLGVRRIIASPVHVGSGTVKCAHGILPVPAPATALILRGVPIYGGEIKGELCTPTGAALLKHFVTEFGPMPSMTTHAIGYGMGRKDFPAANCVRAILGHTAAQSGAVLELSCNLDDMTAEEIGFAMERLLEAGALDVFTTPIGMKKCRPGTMLSVLCRTEDRQKLTQALFRHTTTLGIRQYALTRCTLERRTETLDTPYGPVRQKLAWGYGVERQKLEYEDTARIAREWDLELRTVKELI